MADFGFSTYLAGSDGKGMLTTILGTEAYMAPEIQLRMPYKGTQVDLFATGIILFIMYSGTPPFSKAIPGDPYYKLLCTNKHRTFWAAHSRNKPGKKKFFSKSFKDLINAMLAFDPVQRPSLADIKASKWFKGSVPSEKEMKEEFAQRKQAVDKAQEAEF